MTYASREADQYTLRFPAGMREAIKKAAKATGMSMNSWIIHQIQKSLDAPPTQEDRVMEMRIRHAAAARREQDLHADLQRVADSLSKRPAELRGPFETSTATPPAGLNITLWKPEPDLVIHQAIGKACEEANEVGKILARILIQGLDATDPPTGKPNRTALFEEIADLDAAIQWLREVINDDYDADRADRKLRGFRRWQRMLEELDR